MELVLSRGVSKHNFVSTNYFDKSLTWRLRLAFGTKQYSDKRALRKAYRSFGNYSTLAPVVNSLGAVDPNNAAHDATFNNFRLPDDFFSSNASYTTPSGVTFEWFRGNNW